MLTLPVRLTHREAAACLQALRATLDATAAEQVVALDVAPLAQFDSSALAVILALRRACGQRGTRLRVQGWSDHLRELAQIYGVADLLGQPG